MSNLRRTLFCLGTGLGLVAFSITEGSGANAQGAGQDWEKFSIPGATVKFEMPKPVKMNEQPKEGMVVYASQKGKMSFKVGIVNRNYAQDQAKGLTDDKVLENFSLRILAACKMQFKQMGLESKFEFVKDLKATNGIGKQFQAKVGKAFVIDRFYVNKQGLFWVEATSQDPNNADFNRFLNSFTP